MENEGQLLKGERSLVSHDMEKAEVLNGFFSFSTVRLAFRNQVDLRCDACYIQLQAVLTESFV